MKLFYCLFVIIVLLVLSFLFFLLFKPKNSVASKSIVDFSKNEQIKNPSRNLIWSTLISETTNKENTEIVVQKKVLLNRSIRASDRNEAMNFLGQKKDSEFPDLLVTLVNCPNEDDVIHAWAVQHLGMHWQWWQSTQKDAGIETLLWKLSDGSTKSHLPEREALFALAHHPEERVRSKIDERVKIILQDSNSPILDLGIRLAAKAKWKGWQKAVQPFLEHTDFIVRQAARVALKSEEHVL